MATTDDSSGSNLPGAAIVADLPTRGMELIDRLVELLRDKTVRPMTLVTRALVFGVIVFAASVVTITLLSITLIRILTVYAFGGRVWISDLVVGSIFVIGGLLLWRMRTEPTPGGSQ